MRFKSLKTAVVGAKLPMPSASKKLVANPMRRSTGRGRRSRHVRPCWRGRSSAYQRHAKAIATAPSAASRPNTPLLMRCPQCTGRAPAASVLADEYPFPVANDLNAPGVALFTSSGVKPDDGLSVPFQSVGDVQSEQPTELP
jgi:hypothetical protein